MTSLTLLSATAQNNSTLSPQAGHSKHSPSYLHSHPLPFKLPSKPFQPPPPPPPFKPHTALPLSPPTMAFLCYTKTTTLTTSYQPLTVLQILWTALHLPTKSSSLFFPLLLLSILSSSSLFLYFSTTISPPLQDLLSKLCILLKDPRGPAPPHLFHEIQKDLKDFASLAAVIAPLYFLVSLLLTVATINTLAAAYTDKGASLTPRTLILRVVRRAYQTMVTCMYILLFGIGYVVVATIVVGTALLITTTDESLNLTSVSTGTCLMSFAVLLFFYLATRGSMSVVITAVEETWGIGALSWSVELFIGNKQRGTLLTLILMSVRTAIYGALATVIASRPPKPVDEQTKLIILGAAFVALLELYSMAAYTVFYYECRKSHGLDDVAAAEEQGFIYSSLSTGVTAAKVDALYYGRT